MVIEDTHQMKIATEFDGDKHYCDIRTIKRDNDKDLLAKRIGIKVVRIPYWVQLTTETLQYFFNIRGIEVKQDFPHGFIDKKAVLPASYCELGIERFIYEFRRLPKNVQDRITKSLKDSSEKNGIEYVVPRLIKEELGMS